MRSITLSNVEKFTEIKIGDSKSIFIAEVGGSLRFAPSSLSS